MNSLNINPTMEVSIDETQVQNILAKSGLDFTVVKTRLQENGRNTPYFSLRNSKNDAYLNVVGEGYHVTQNEDVLRMVMTGAKPFGGLDLAFGHSFNGGKRICFQLELTEAFNLDGDRIKQYITVIDSNDGSATFSVGYGDFTMSCDNQFWYFSKINQFKFRHTASLEAKLKALPKMIEDALKMRLQIQNAYKFFKSTPASKDLVNQMSEMHFGITEDTPKEKLVDVSTRKINMMNEFYSSAKTEMASKGQNLWGLHSATTHWTTHKKTAPNRDNGRIESLMVGSNYKTNSDSMKFALKTLENLGHDMRQFDLIA